MLFAGPASRQITYMYSHVLWRSFTRILIFSYSVWTIRIWNTCYVQSRSRNCTKPFSLSQKRCFHLFENEGHFLPTGINLSANTFVKTVQFCFITYLQNRRYILFIACTLEVTIGQTKSKSSLYWSSVVEICLIRPSIFNWLSASSKSLLRASLRPRF